VSREKESKLKLLARSGAVQMKSTLIGSPVKGENAHWKEKINLSLHTVKLNLDQFQNL
jgi:hypothetical protein